MTSKFEAISLISYLSKKKKIVYWLFYFYYSIQKYDDSIRTFFPFSKRQFPQNSNVVFP